MLAGKKILLGISGSIAAYKAPLIVRLLVKAGAEVKVIMTPAASDFVSPLTLSTLSKNQVLSGLFESSAWANHVALGRWADLMMIAPLSCNTLAKMANGLCDNLLMAVYLSATCPVAVAPAMDEDMWHHPSTKKNLDTIRGWGNMVMDVGVGELASGLTGPGRMAEPEEILSFITAHFSEKKVLKGRKALVTAGPTYEAIDPVRFIGNHSSGKMGFAIAEELASRGALVTLVSGPVDLQVTHPSIKLVRVTSALEMYEACMRIDYEIAVMAAAVADYAPVQAAPQKIKKAEPGMLLELKKTTDILAHLGREKKAGQVLVGFALETENEVANAELKLKKKNADIIVLNSLQDAGAGFGHDTNKVTLFFKDGTKKVLELESKARIAKHITDALIESI